MKNYNLYNKREEYLSTAQSTCLILCFFQLNWLISKLYLISDSMQWVNTLSIVFITTLTCFTLSSYFKVKHVICFNLRVLKLIPHIDLRKCLICVKRVATYEELLKANLINILILCFTAANNTIIYKSTVIHSLLVTMALFLQLVCYLLLVNLKKRQLILFFPGQIAKSLTR
jgi:hypothetical protein